MEIKVNHVSSPLASTSIRRPILQRLLHMDSRQKHAPLTGLSPVELTDRIISSKDESTIYRVLSEVSEVAQAILVWSCSASAWLRSQQHFHIDNKAEQHPEVYHMTFQLSEERLH
jgi:hypothetical protein